MNFYKGDTHILKKKIVSSINGTDKTEHRFRKVKPLTLHENQLKMSQGPSCEISLHNQEKHFKILRAFIKNSKQNQENCSIQ